MFKKFQPAPPPIGSNGAKKGSASSRPNGHAPAAAKNGHSNGHTPTNGKIETVIGAGASLNGALVAKGGVRIDGGFDGTIEVAGPLVIGEDAKIVAEIKAHAVSVAGTVKGNITADKMEILSTGRVYGDLEVIAFSTEEGAYLRGQVKMQDAEAVAPPEAETLAPA